MNLKTTFLLLILLIGGALSWAGWQRNWFGLGRQQPQSVTGETLAILENELKPDKLTQIEVCRGERCVTLKHGSGGWTLPGNWPTREQEVQELLGILTGMETRFAPLTVGPAEVAAYQASTIASMAASSPGEAGLLTQLASMPVLDWKDSDWLNVKYGLLRPVTMTVKVEGDKTYKLAFGEQPDPNHRFPAITYLRIDDKPEVVRLAPGLVDILKRPLEVPDYYHRRWLFSRKRDKKEDGQPKSDYLDANALTATNAAGSYTLTHTGTAWDEWQLTRPVHDRADPEKLKTILTALPDLWAEKFVEEKPVTAERAGAVAAFLAPQPLGPDLCARLAWAPLLACTDADLRAAKYGLLNPEQTLTVTRGKDETVTLLIGGTAEVKRGMPAQPATPFDPPPPAPREEELRYARLRDNERIFTIKTDKLKDVFVEAGTLRDQQLARFQTKDVRRIKITHGGQEINLVKDKDRWKLQDPVEADAEETRVNELLDKLSSTQVTSADMIDGADPKTYGLEPPEAIVKLAVEDPKKEDTRKESDKPAADPQQTRTLTFTIGKKGDANKAYVRVNDWQRVNAVDDGLLKLVQRPAVAYRGRRIFDFTAGELARVEVKQGMDRFELERAKDAWRLTTPVKADADAGKTGKLAADLGQLEAVEYVADSADAEDLKGYGLAEPALGVTVSFTKQDKQPRTLFLGKQRGDKPEYFARLASSPAVFVVKKEVRDALEQGSLAYRPVQLWDMQPENITDLHIQRGSESYHLKRAGQAWRIVEPFEATAMTNLVQPMVNDLASLRCERYVTHAASDLVTYGLDKPSLRLAIRAASNQADDNAGKEEKDLQTRNPPGTSEHVLLIGKPTAAAAPSRYAKLATDEAVFVVDDKVVAAVDRSALDLLDRNLLALDADAVTRIQGDGPGGALTLKREGDAWQAETASVKFPADREVMTAVLGVWSHLRAERFAAYGPKVDPAEYGLDKPVTTIAITTRAAAKPEHTLVLGKAIAGNAGGRYARLDGGPGVFVLGPAAVAELSRGHLDFVDRTLLKLNAAKVTGIHRRKGTEVLEIVKQDDAWQVVNPAPQRADDRIMQDLVEQLASLRAKRVAAYPAKDLASYGLDDPAAVVALRLAGPEGKDVQHVLRVGESADKGAASARGDRFVRVDDSDVVGVIPGTLVRRLVVATPLQFRDHNLLRFADADRATLERGPRKAVFAKMDGTWKLVSPIEAEAEHADLEEFVNDLARFRADELVDDKPAGTPYGLVKPEARWRFQSGDKDVLDLVVGAEEKGTSPDEGTPRRYARLASRDLVFFLSPRMTSKVLGEYRKRSPWPALDSAQVEMLSYGHAEKPFVLEKVNNAWQVAGKSDFKVKSEAVTETLDALARLRVERYVADRDADFKLYGLDPPQLALEVRTPTGKRLLHIGRHEGDSKRYYARVLDENRSDVFVISEADAARIVRDLQAFTPGAAKPESKVPEEIPKKSPAPLDK